MLCLFILVALFHVYYSIYFIITLEIFGVQVYNINVKLYAKI